jgi:hypothetical protein
MNNLTQGFIAGFVANARNKQCQESRVRTGNLTARRDGLKTGSAMPSPAAS